MTNSIVFHARKSQEENTPIFTVRFSAEKDFEKGETLFCVVSKPHPGLESYCKKAGNKLTTDRLYCLKNEFKTGHRQIINIMNGEKEIQKFLPHGTTKILNYYAERAKRFFKLENPKMVIRGTKINWQEKDYGALAVKTPVILITQLNALN